MDALLALAKASNCDRDSTQCAQCSRLASPMANSKEGRSQDQSHLGTENNTTQLRTPPSVGAKKLEGLGDRLASNMGRVSIAAGVPLILHTSTPSVLQDCGRLEKLGDAFFHPLRPGRSLSSVGDGKSEEPPLRRESSQCVYGPWVTLGCVGEDDCRIGEVGERESLCWWSVSGAARNKT